ncbi:MAG: hypothetical protein ACRECX_06935 [Methyloceanibacter sp.]|uniref:hypothetical protein n=1 Tax=Methyloceanibacter sp. TaxID=1965321 RepID=UPI003D6C92F9
MLRFSKTALVLLGAAGILAGTFEPAAARCQLIVATNSASSKTAAARAAHQNAIDNANALKRRYGWKYVNLRARKVTPDPFWKSVRPVVTRDMLLKPDVVTAQTYSQCWKGVVVPFVCTAGAVACGN